MGRIKHSSCACDTDQHSSPSETHHAHAAFEHEALKVRGGNLQLQGLGAVDTVRLLGLSVGVVHALHVFPQLVFPLRVPGNANIISMLLV